MYLKDSFAIMIKPKAHTSGAECKAYSCYKIYKEKKIILSSIFLTVLKCTVFYVNY